LNKANYGKIIIDEGGEPLMDIQQFAAMLNGKEIYKEITREEERQAKELGIVVVFGHSDDNIEFRGAINDEVGCHKGRTIYLNKDGLFEECEYAGNFRDGCKYVNMAKAQCKTIEAVWDGGEGYSWTYRTGIPHATFDILEDGEKFCRGIVFNIKELQ
jgi:hypothetical protein